MASSITIESLLLRQSKMDSRMDKVDTIIVAILQLLQSSKVSTSTIDTIRLETRGKESSGDSI